LMRGIDDLKGRVADVSPTLVGRMRADLERAYGVIGELLGKHDGGKSHRRSRLDEEE